MKRNHVLRISVLMGATLIACDPDLDVGGEPMATESAGSTTSQSTTSQSTTTTDPGTSDDPGSASLPEPSTGEASASETDGTSTGSTGSASGSESTTEELATTDGEDRCCVHTGEVSSPNPGEIPLGCPGDPALEACVCDIDPSCCDPGPFGEGFWHENCIAVGDALCGATCSLGTCNCDPLDASSCGDGQTCVRDSGIAGKLVCSIGPADRDEIGSGCFSNYACENGAWCAPQDSVPGCAESMGCCTPLCHVDGDCLDGQTCVPYHAEAADCGGLGVCSATGDVWWD